MKNNNIQYIYIPNRDMYKREFFLTNPGHVLKQQK